MITFLTVVQILVVIALVIVVLLQQSEGGGLGIGGGTAGGLMTARGATDLLTRSTAILAGVFIARCLLLAVLATAHNAPAKIDTSLAHPGAAAPVRAPAPATPAPAPIVPLAK